MSKTQIIIMGIFIAAAVFAVVIFAGYKGGGIQEVVNLTMWGTFDARQMSPLMDNLNDQNENVFSIQYVQKDESSYQEQLIDALASGVGPDIWMTSHDAILKNRNKIFPLSFESFPERNFKDFFIDSASSLFILDALSAEKDAAGREIIGFPLAVDPMVLYWNRDLFSSAGVANPPQYWDEFLTDVEILTKQDDAGNIIQSGAALGEFINVKNSKDILSMLILQTGSPIVQYDPQAGGLSAVFGESGSSIVDPVENSVQFFNEFSNPKKSSYSWNRVLPDSDDVFVNGSLAMYFGYAGEFEEIKIRNPHLNFDVVAAPQIRPVSADDIVIKSTFGKIYSLVVSKAGPNIQSSFSAVFGMVGEDFSKSFAETVGLAPARRDVLAEGISDPFFSVFYRSAIMARAWLDPDPDATYQIFKNMVESTAAGKARVSEAVNTAKAQMDQLLK